MAGLLGHLRHLKSMVGSWAAPLPIEPTNADFGFADAIIVQAALRREQTFR